MFGLEKLKKAYIASFHGEGATARIEIQAFSLRHAKDIARDYFLAEPVEIKVRKK